MKNKVKRTFGKGKGSRGSKVDNRKLVDIKGFGRKEKDSPNFVPRVEQVNLRSLVQEVSVKSDELKGLY